MSSSSQTVYVIINQSEQSSRSQTHGFSDLFLGRSPLRCEPRRFF
uniref:Uncharacterized protein n=1 Tax=Vitis vinifera TaxID=29760 RepID=F6H6M5_VITVI